MIWREAGTRTIRGVTRAVPESERTIHVDVFAIPPQRHRPMWVLFTTGMSARPMTLSAEARALGVPDRAELVLALPPDAWIDDDLPTGRLPDEHRYWPIRLLQRFARYPHERGVWLDVGHSVSNGKPDLPWSPDPRFTSVLFTPPVGIVAEPWTTQVDDGRRFQLLSPILLDATEMQYKIERGLDAVLERFDRLHVGTLLDLRRRSVVDGSTLVPA
jgi:hypothetical protein